MRRYKIFGRAFLAHNAQCADGFKADRLLGVVYGPYRYADGTFALNREEASCRDRFCAYCGGAS